MDNIIKGYLKDRLPSVRFDEIMKKHTSMKVGGKADAFIYVKEKDELLSSVRAAKECGIDYKIVGNCSNIIIRDGGYRGLIISMGKLLGGIKKDGTVAVLGAGIPMYSAHMFCSLNELGGLEWAYGIPGTIGGACYMNAGAFNFCMGDFVKSVEIFEDDEVKILERKDVKFEYRNTSIKEKKQIIISCALQLFKSPSQEIIKKQNEAITKRKQTQPLEFPSSGSIFKRAGDFIPSKAIDELGLKGYRIGDAEISKKHAGFIVNRKNASCAQIEKLIAHMKEKVFAEFGVKIEEEVEIIGEI